MSLKIEIILIVICLNLNTFVECAFDNCADNETLNLESDGYQYVRGHDPLISILYHEWWFFSFYDPLVDIGFCVDYSVMDPAKKFDIAVSGISGMLWTAVENNTGQEPINILDPYLFKEFSAYKENSTVYIGKTNFIKVINERNYEVVGSSRDGQISWWLTFEQMSYACRHREEIPGVFQLDWVSYMPSAYVSGFVQYKNEIYPIETTAYHDHDYGAWPTNLFNWTWAQFNRVDKNFSFILAGYHVPETQDEYVGYLFIRWENQRIKIGSSCGDYFHFEPLEWQIVDGKRYSIHNKVEAFNTKYRIVIEYKARVSNNNAGGHGLGLKVFEQISHYQADLYKKNGEDWIILQQNLTGHGFSEWCNLDI